ncbi:FAD:protein FMN transferase [Paremcibacter congregatus]|nr:FAD:protein FMN transferase [Paremcibacter congregatus]
MGAIPVNRRRFISISAAAIGVGMLPGVSWAQGGTPLRYWQGAAMGAKAQIQLYGADEAQAEAVFRRCRTEIDRLEGIFSLYRPQSQISRLNETGFLDNPPLELLDVMSRCQACWQNSGGAFDITIQPLWRLYADHFATAHADPAGPSEADIRQTLELVGSDKVTLGSRRIELQKPGMGISLNGVAQGYITDRVVALLRAAGFENCLVYMGETYAMGQHDDGRPWTAGISSPLRDRKVLARLPLRDQALATSGGYGSPFSDQSRLHHLLDPRSGHSATHYGSVSVVARDTMTADMLSTALYVMAPDKRDDIWGKYPALLKAVFVDETGHLTSYPA